VRRFEGWDGGSQDGTEVLRQVQSFDHEPQASDPSFK
jgi:hypothetical protein